MDSHTSPRLGRALSLFSGAGGLDVGLEAAGIETVACVELDMAARETLRLNRPHWVSTDHTDVLQASEVLSPKDLGLRRRQLDLIVGGPPCQPFSKAAQWNQGARRGMDDDRALPLHGMLRLVERFLPKAVLIENVAGYVQGRGNAREALATGLADINYRNGTRYRLDVAIINAADYGVAQNRTRAIIVARRDGQPFYAPQPTHAGDPLTAWDALHDLPSAPWEARRGAWTELLPSIPEGGNYLHLTARGGGPELFGWRTRFWSFLLKLAADRPAWTLPASPGPNTGPFHWENRPLTVQERLRLQSFPDEWILAGNEREQVKMSGNATPPALAEAVGRALVKDLRLGATADRTKLLGSAPTLVRPRASAKHVVVAPARLPKSFERLVGAKVAHPGVGRGPAPHQVQGDNRKVA